MEVSQENKQLCDRMRTCYFSAQRVRHIDLFGSDSGESIGIARSYIYHIRILKSTVQTIHKSCDPLPTSCWVQRRSSSKSEKNIQYTPDYFSKKPRTSSKHKFAHR